MLPRPFYNRPTFREQANKTKSLNWHHFEPEYLPPRSPDLNAIERLWLRMKADWFNG
ncbi:MAG: transposase [Verrucomicrobiaceae bacterium]|nr:transposase [Verrucomicrobiaceae bacterium]